MPKILLVDDDDALRKVLRLTLVKMGHAVVEARNGKEALALQRNEPFELILTDLIMPEKEGLETIEEFRKKFPEVKIIAMSGGGRVSVTDYLKIAKVMGADGILAKPFSNDEMAAAIDAVLAED
jgi:DNA-binding response OmpR family regulator